MRCFIWGPVASLATLVMSAAPASAALVVTYHMDELRGPWIIDSTGNGNHGLLGYDAVHTGDAKFGRAVAFDGVGDHSSAPDSASLDSITGGITVEGWFKLTSDPNINANNNYRMLFSKGGRGGPWDMVLEQSRASQWSVRVDNGAGGSNEYRFFSADATFNVGEWTHFAYTYDAATGIMGIYKNGVGTFSTRTPAALITNNLPFYLSHPNNDPGQNGQGALPGILDEVAVYSHALTPAEVLARFGGGPPEPAMPAGPVADVAVYRFDEAGGATAYDSTLFTRHGTLAGGFSRQPGMFGGAVRFDGVSGHMRAHLPAAESPTSGMTLAGWFYLDQDPNVDANNNWRWMFNKGGWATPFDAILEQVRDVTFSIRLDGDPTHYRWRVGPAIPLDQWTHIAMSYDGATGMMRYYFNGAEYTHYIGTTGDLAANDLDFFLSWPSGTAAPNGHGAFPGLMDEVALFGRALSRDEILTLYAFGPPEAFLPEPGALALFGAGAGLLVLVRLARRKAPACC